jgi:hypothetical protein
MCAEGVAKDNLLSIRERPDEKGVVTAVPLLPIVIA